MQKRFLALLATFVLFTAFSITARAEGGGGDSTEPTIKIDEADKEELDFEQGPSKFGDFNNDESHMNVPEELGKEYKFDLLFESDIFSKYVSKGLPCSEGPVWQPSLSIEYYNVGVNVWSNFVINGEPDQGRFNEVDITPYYDLHIGNFNMVPGVNFIIGLGGSPLSLNSMTHDIVRPQVHLAYDIGHFTPYADIFTYVYPTNRMGVYSTFGLLFNYDISETLEINNSVQFSVGGKRWNRPRIADAGTTLNNFEYILSLVFNINKSMAISSVFHVVTTIPDKLRQNLTDPDLVWGGLTLTYDL